MKKYIYLLLFCSLLLTTLISCEKDVVSLVGNEISLSAQDLLLLRVDQEIIFQFSVVETDTGEESGWFIHKNGDVKSYASQTSFGNPTENQIWTTSRLTELSQQGDLDLGKVEPQELWDNFLLLKKVNPDQLSDIESSPGTSNIHAYYAFSKRGEAIASDETAGCNGYAHYEESGNEKIYDRTILQMEGRANRYNFSEEALNVSKWLSNINDGL